MEIINKIITFYNNLNNLIKAIVIGLLLLIIFIISSIVWYNSCIGSVSSKSEKVSVEIKLGSGTDAISNELKKVGVIRSKLAFKLYTKFNDVTGLQAGKYTLDKNMNLKQITEALKKGKVSKEQVEITFTEGKNIMWIANKIATSLASSDDQIAKIENSIFELLEDENYINSLIDNYWFLTKDITNNDVYYPLEGYLFPDTYFFDKETVTVKEIFKQMLDKMDTELSKYDFKKSKYSVHEILTMASIVELESTNTDSRKDVASVMYNRIDSGMSLGSDVTTYYAYKINIGERDLKSSELYTYNPYNTRGPNMFGKLPVGPICSPSLSSIDAAINPNNTNYLYFVADKNGKVYFTKTSSEHNSIVYKLKQEGLWYEYN